MVSESFTGEVSPIGDGLALLIAVAFSIATVITRRFAHVRMTPATCLGTMIAAAFAASQASDVRRSATRHGASCLPSARSISALASPVSPPARGCSRRPSPRCSARSSPMLGPIWVWLIHAEVPSARTIFGGTVVFAALLIHIGLEFQRQSRPQGPA